MATPKTEAQLKREGADRHKRNNATRAARAAAVERAGHEPGTAADRAINRGAGQGTARAKEIDLRRKKAKAEADETADEPGAKAPDRRPDKK